MTAMGYQPGLDGLRALSVIAVILYHAGFTWMPGGFIGVEVFFVVSGFLITSLLLHERERSGGVSLGQFWRRRARRLLPSLVALLLVVAVGAALFGSAAQTDELRRDLPWALSYLANWGQILGEVPYFSTGDPPLLRHLWSLAVEEQWYLVWPLLFLALIATRLSLPRIGALVAAAAVTVMVFTAWLASSPSPLLGGPPALFDGVDRINFVYLSTVTRSSGLLLGAAAAFVWRPWRSPAARRAPSRPLDLAAGAALGVLACASLAAHVVDRSLYQWVLPLVSASSLVTVLVVVHPAAVGIRHVLSLPWLVAIGRRSYGLYLWHWPVFVVLDATSGAVDRFVVAIAVSAVLTEVSFRVLETPIRVSGLRGWWSSWAPERTVPLGAATAVVLVLGVGAFYWSVGPHDPALGGADAVFELSTNGSTPTAAPTPPSGTAATAGTAAPTVTAATAAASVAPEPVELVILGDSQAHSLAVNLPSGIEDTFTVVNGALPGCGVMDRGRVRSERATFGNDFAACEGWQQEWADAATGSEVALVLVGAWDVFDVEIDGTLYRFGTPDGDELFRSALRSGVDAVRAAGVEVALLEIPCMRPVPAEGAAVPPLPERADDARVERLNALLRQVAASYPADVAFVEGPDEWCADAAVATDLGYRWDGIHVYTPGANLIYTTIAPTLLDLAA